jgi:hypothetical protein
MGIDTKRFITRVYADDVLMAESDTFDIWHGTLKRIHEDQRRKAIEAARAEAEKEMEASGTKKRITPAFEDDEDDDDLEDD